MAYVKNELPDAASQGELFHGPMALHLGRIGVVSADGLASNGVEVTPGNQKIFPVGANYILGTGAGDRIRFIADQIKDAAPLSAEQVGQQIIDLSKEYFVFQPGEQLNFIVVGRERGELRAYSVLANRTNKPIMERNGGFLADGSGSQFVAKALQRDAQRGLLSADNKNDSIADLAIRLFDLGHVAKSSAGVNDEIQYGFITEAGNATLIHPYVTLSHPPKEYLGEDGKVDPQKVEANALFYSELNKRLIEAYRVIRDSNRATTFLLGKGTVHDKDKLYEFLDHQARTLSKVRRTLNEMIIDFVVKKNHPN